MAHAAGSPANARSREFARQFEDAQRGFIGLVESLTDEQWRRIARNFPSRINDEDEARTVGVIAHHVAVGGPWIMDRIAGMLAGRTLSPVDMKTMNAHQAAQMAAVTRDQVLQILRDSLPDIVERIRAIPDSELDLSRDTPVGPMTVAQRLERVLIGHIKMHEGSIRATIG